MKTAVGFGFQADLHIKKPKNLLFLQGFSLFFHMNISVTMELDSKKRFHL
jgi:hypothetical protein